MKIVGKSNFEIETVSDVLLCENVLNDCLAKIICNALNSDEGTYFYEIKPDNYKLYKWEP